MIILKGIGTQGFAKGKAFRVERQSAPESVSQGKGVSVDFASLSGQERISAIEAEKQHFLQSLSIVKEDLRQLASSSSSEMSDIFAAHLEMADDPLLEEETIGFIEEGNCAVDALACAEQKICAMFADIDDEYLKARTEDVRDVCGRLARKLSMSEQNAFECIPDGSIIVAESLSPSDTALMDFSKIRGFVTEKGSVTSHVCIIAHTKGIPAMVGVKGCMDAVSEGDEILVNGSAATVIVNPSDHALEEYESNASAYLQRMTNAVSAASERVVTGGGKSCLVYGNAGNVQDVRLAIEAGADGIGLFRSEFLYMDSQDFPSEETQFEAYRAAAEIAGQRPLVIRTLDIGGDKDLSYMQLPREENPFLGVRAVRLCLERQDMFKTQIRAILRSAAFGNVRMLIPMLTCVDELKKVRELVGICARELRNEGADCNPDIPVGVMIETPAAAIASDIIAKEADFFSVGTNDLVQYVMAADRGNSSVSQLYDIRNVSVQRLMKLIADNAASAGIEVEICGEAASDLSLSETFIQMGYSSFSVSAPSVALLKDNLRQVDF